MRTCAFNLITDCSHRSDQTDAKRPQFSIFFVQIWRVIDGSLLGTLRGHKRGIWCVRFSPVDQCLATSSADATIKIWALSDLSCVKTFEGHDSSVLKVAFMTRGMQLMSW